MPDKGDSNEEIIHNKENWKKKDHFVCNTDEKWIIWMNNEKKPYIDCIDKHISVWSQKENVFFSTQNLKRRKKG